MARARGCDRSKSGILLNIQMSSSSKKQASLWCPWSDIKSVFLVRTNKIDGLRGLCILMVILFHCFFVLKIVLPQASFERLITSIPPILSPLLNFDKAVDIFFVISGYLIGSALLSEKERSGTIRISPFFRRRFFRIFPLFWIAMLLYGSFSWKGDWESLVINLIFLENLIPSATKIVPVGWSLAIEVQFYLLVPFLFVMSSAVVYKTLLVVLVLSVTVRFGLLVLNPDFYKIAPIAYLTGETSGSALLDTLYYPTWSRISPIILGLLIPFLLRRQKNWLEKRVAFLSVVGVGCFVIGLSFPSYAINTVAFPPLHLISLTLDRTLVGLSIVFLILSWELWPLRMTSISQRFFLHWCLGIWGRLVYPAYLFHLPMVAIAFLIVFRTTKPALIQEASLFDVLIAFPLSLLLMMPIILSLHVLIERPLIRFGARGC